MKHFLHLTFSLVFAVNFLTLLIFASHSQAATGVCTPQGDSKIGIWADKTELQKTASGPNLVSILVCWNDKPYDRPVIVALIAAKAGESVNTDAEVAAHEKTTWSLAADAPKTTEVYAWNFSGSGSDDQPTDYVLTVKAFEATTDSAGHHPYVAGQVDTINFKILPSEGTGGGTGGGGSGEGDSGGGTGGDKNESSIDLTLPGMDGSPAISTISAFYNAIIVVLRYVVMVAALIGVIYGGITLLQAAGDPQKVTIAKKIIITSIVGLVLATFTNWIIAFVINSLLGLK